jgi:hypothetical protein
VVAVALVSGTQYFVRFLQRVTSFEGMPPQQEP